MHTGTQLSLLWTSPFPFTTKESASEDVGLDRTRLDPDIDCLVLRIFEKMPSKTSHSLGALCVLTSLA